MYNPLSTVEYCETEKELKREYESYLEYFESEGYKENDDCILDFEQFCDEVTKKYSGENTWPSPEEVYGKNGLWTMSLTRKKQ